MKIIITESQLNHLITENQKIKVTDFCGRTKEVDYQKWYYNNGQVVAPYVKCYSWDGKSYKFTDWSCEFKNWNTMSNEERKSAIEGKKRVAGCGTADRFGVAASLKEILTFENVVDLVSVGLELIPGLQLVGKGIDVAQAISYLVKGVMSTNSIDKTSNFVNGIFQSFSVISLPTFPLPGYVSKKIGKLFELLGKIEDYVDNFMETVPTFMRVVYAYVGEVVGESFRDLQAQLVTNILIPLMKAVQPYNEGLSNILKKVISELQQMSANISSGIILANKMEETDPNAFT